MLDEYNSLTVSARFISYLRDYLLDQGFDADIYLTQYDPNLQNYELSVPVDISTICQLFEGLADKLNKPYFGYDLAANFHYENSSLLVNAILSAKNVGAFFDTLVKYDKYVDTAIEVNFTLHGAESCCEIEVFSPKGTVTNQLYLYLISFIILSLKKTTRITLPLTKVVTVNKALADMLSKKFCLDTLNISSGSTKNKLFFDSAFLTQVFYSSNVIMHDILCSGLDRYFSQASIQRNLVDVVRREILIQNSQCVANISNVSKGLNLSERTLSRRLTELNVTFKELKQQTILARSKYYLTQTTMPLADIAHELKYSETSAFCRAFKRFYGQSPQEYRTTR